MQTTILEYLNKFYFTERSLERNSRLFVLMKVGIFGAFLDRTPTLSDLNSETLNRFIINRLETRSRETVRGERSALRAIWSDAHERGLVRDPPTRIRKIKRDLATPKAWTQTDLRQLLIESARQRGLFRGKNLCRASYWGMFFRVAYDTGLRLGDLERIKSSFFTGPGTYMVTQHKTGSAIPVSIGDDTWKAVAATNPANREYLIRVLGRGAFFSSLKRITDACGLEGATKMIRKAAGSMFERENPGEGHKLLGNGREVFLRYYADPRITDIQGRLPPRISG